MSTELGLCYKEIKQFIDLTIKANLGQLGFMKAQIEYQAKRRI